MSEAIAQELQEIRIACQKMNIDFKNHKTDFANLLKFDFMPKDTYSLDPTVWEGELSMKVELIGSRWHFECWGDTGERYHDFDSIDDGSWEEMQTLYDSVNQ